MQLADKVQGKERVYGKGDGKAVHQGMGFSWSRDYNGRRVGKLYEVTKIGIKVKK